MESKNFLIIDAGQFISQANALSNNGKNKCWYYTSSEKSFPLLEDIAPGRDFEHLERVPYLFDFMTEHKDEIDCICNFDSANQDLISYLRDDPFWSKKSIFGSGLGVRLEDDRVGFKKILAKIGLDVGKENGTNEGDYKVVHGVNELEEYSKKHPDIYAKIDKYRGTFETTHLEDYKDEILEGTFDEIRHELGPPFKDTQKFIVEHAIGDSVEIGMDGFFGKFGLAESHTWGLEWKKGPYLCTNGKFPKYIENTIKKLSPILNALQYQGCMSTEEKITKAGKDYLIDFCARGALPLTIGYSSWIKNFDEVVYKIGSGEEVKVDMPYRYMLAMPLYSAEGEENYVRIKIDPKHKDKIKYRGVCSDGKGNYWSIKGVENMVAIVLGGDSWKELIEQAKEEVEFVDFEGKEDYQVSILDKFPELIKECEDMGIPF
jgi:hypothetical protein